MKTILIPIDFSVPAENAAYYSLYLARVLDSNLTLCYAFAVPSEVFVQEAGSSLYEYSAMKASTLEQLNTLADKLKAYFRNDPETKSFPVPIIHYESEVGGVSDLIYNLVKDQKETMVVMGMAEATAVSWFFSGSTSHHLINVAQVPILLIPSETAFRPIKRIAFATDFKDEDIEVIRSLAVLAGKYDADLVITHVKDEWANDEECRQKEHLFLDKLITGIKYPKLYMRHITDIDIDNGLELLSLEYKIDLVVMVHRKLSIFTRLLKGSHSQSLAKHIKIPLMIIPENLHPVF